MTRILAATLALAGCAGGAGDGNPIPRMEGTPSAACDGYPEGAVRPMEVDSVLFPYSWPEAVNMVDGSFTALDLGQVPCATDPVIDWSPFDVLLFVSIPAW